MSKEITNDELFALIQGEFSLISDRFDSVDKKFDSMDKKFDLMRKDVNELKRIQDEILLKFTNVAWAIDLNDIDRRLKVLEGKVG